MARRKKGLGDRHKKILAVLEHFQNMLAFHGLPHGLHRYRKHLRGYVRRSGLPRWYRSQMLICDNADELVELLQTSVERFLT